MITRRMILAGALGGLATAYATETIAKNAADDRASMAIMKVGDALLSQVEEIRIPNNISSFTADKELIAANRYWLYPHFLNDSGGFDLVFHSWIVEVGGRVILIDPCTGNRVAHPVKYFSNLDVPYLERMQASGYRPQDIEFVVCTHLHHDHCGWNTQLRDGKRVPTFPNARYIIQKLEYDDLAARHASLPPSDLNRGVFERSVEPVMRAGLVDLVSGSHKIIPEMTVELALGHTPGHQMAHLESGGRHVFFAGDSFHHPIQLVEPSIMFGQAYDVNQLIRTRKRLVGLSVDLNAYLIGAHIQAPYAVRATRATGPLRFSAGV